MKKILAFILLLSAGFLTWGCSDSGDTAPGAANQLAESTYRGVIPCADCEGILYELSLEQDKSFEASSMYIGESTRPFVEHGTWNIEDDTLLVLQEDSGNSRAWL